MKEARADNVGPVEKIERKWSIRLLYKLIDEVKKISQEQPDKVIERYPLISAAHDIIKAFKETLFSKKPEEPEKWMEDSQNQLTFERALFMILVAKNRLDCFLKSIGAVRFCQWCFAPLRDSAIDKTCHL